MRSDEFEALLDLSARVGADPALTQGAGGNSSIKEGGTLWIKASGLWLAHAREREVMVPVTLDPLLAALERDVPAAEKPEAFTDTARNPLGLRPSIETTVHALMPDRVVLHVHCVETIALAIRADARAALSARLEGLAWSFVPYARPGLPLARAIAAYMQEGANVLVLGNHGLVVSGETVAETEALLRAVTARLAAPQRPAPAPDLAALARLAVNSGYRLPDDAETHRSATDLAACRFAAGGSLYPDHVIFLGVGAAIAGPAESAADCEARYAEAGLTPPPLLLFPGKGVLVAREITAGAAAMARCLADVLTRVPEEADLVYLTAAENEELLGWDAEKYRQMLNRTGGAVQ